MMKGLIVSPTQRINLDKDSSRTRDVKGIREYFISIGYQIDIASYAKTWDFNKKGIINDLEADYNAYDAIIVYNDTNNFFGGEVKEHTVQQIQKISNFTGNLFYVFTDPKLYKTCAKKLYNKNLIDLETLNKYMSLEWNIIWPGRDMTAPFWGNIKSIQYCDIFKFINGYLNYNRNIINFNDREFDLVYYGDYRDTRKKVFDKYFNNTISKLMIGMSGSNYMAKYLPKCDQSQLVNLVPLAKCSLTIGDKLHNNNIITTRFMENNIYGVINFIDIEYDPDKILYENKLLKEFLYVSNGFELEEKIKTITESKFNEILHLQDLEYFQKR